MTKTFYIFEINYSRKDGTGDYKTSIKMEDCNNLDELFWNAICKDREIHRNEVKNDYIIIDVIQYEYTVVSKHLNLENQ